MLLIHKKIIIFSASLIFICLFFAGIFYYQTSIRRDSKVQEINFVVEKGESVKIISQNLFEKKLIKSKKFFELFVWWNDKQAKLQAGEYLLNSGETISQIVDKFGNAKASTTKIKIKEGEDIEEIAKNLEAQGLFTKKDFYIETGNLFTNTPVNQEYASKYDILADKPQDSSLEGYLFPDTYQVYKNTKPSDVVEKMLKNLEAKFSDDLRREVAGQGKSIFDIITMASIVEKEVKTPEDMKIVAGIFWHRIKIGQVLQSDATLSYVLNDKTPAHSLEELKNDSLYNSYKYRGLPPGPIGNPGMNAILAAIYPTETDYNFFLTPKDSDKTIFSKDFEEHKLNKQRYLN